MAREPQPLSGIFSKENPAGRTSSLTSSCSLCLSEKRPDLQLFVDLHTWLDSQGLGRKMIRELVTNKFGSYMNGSEWAKTIKISLPFVIAD